MDPAPAAPPPARTVRWFGVLLLVFCAVLGGVLGTQLDAPRVTHALLATGGVLAGLYYAVRPLRLPLLLGWLRVTHPIGVAVSTLLLGIVHFGVVTPIGWIGRAVGRDRLGRRPAPDVASYWTARSEETDPARYLRQS